MKYTVIQPFNFGSRKCLPGEEVPEGFVHHDVYLQNGWIAPKFDSTISADKPEPEIRSAPAVGDSSNVSRETFEGEDGEIESVPAPPKFSMDIAANRDGLSDKEFEALKASDFLSWHDLKGFTVRELREKTNLSYGRAKAIIGMRDTNLETFAAQVADQNLENE
jgi:hypothetical protein